MADEQKQTPPAPPPPAYVPPGQMDVAELQKMMVEDGVITPEQAAAAPANKVAVTSPVTPAAESAPPVSEEPALLKLAKKQAELRKEKEAVAPHLEMLKVFSPQEAQRLAQARASGDPVAALTALGFTHQQYTQKLVGLKAPEAAPEQDAPPAAPEIEALKQEVQALRAERENERVQASRREALGKMESILKDNPKFHTINSLKDYEGIEKVLLSYWSEFQKMPGDTFEESVALAAEVHEAQLKKEAEKWSRALTVPQTSVPVPSKAPDAPRTGSEQPRTLTNANTTAPATVRTVPKTESEILEAIARGDDLSVLDS